MNHILKSELILKIRSILLTHELKVGESPLGDFILRTITNNNSVNDIKEDLDFTISELTKVSKQLEKDKDKSLIDDERFDHIRQVIIEKFQPDTTKRFNFLKGLTFSEANIKLLQEGLDKNYYIGIVEQDGYSMIKRLSFSLDSIDVIIKKGIITKIVRVENIINKQR